jgi:antitoxin FitA
MPVTLSIKNVPDHIVEPLRERAKRNHRSLQGELMAILDEAAKADALPKLTLEEFYAEVKASGFRSPSGSTEIVREMRDARTKKLAKLTRGRQLRVLPPR